MFSGILVVQPPDQSSPVPESVTAPGFCFCMRFPGMLSPRHCCRGPFAVLAWGLAGLGNAGLTALAVEEVAEPFLNGKTLEAVAPGVDLVQELLLQGLAAVL